MTERDTPMADVEIILKADWQRRHDEALAQLKTAGLQIEDIIDEEGVIEGVIPAQRLHELRHLPCVAYARTIFRYEDDAPPSSGAIDAQGFQPL